MLSIIYNNKDSYDDFDLIMEDYPSLPCTRADYDNIEIEGRDGSVTVFKNFTDGELKIDFIIKDDMFLLNQRSIIGWLNNVSSNKELILSENLALFYKVKQISISDIKHEKGLRKFTVTFKTDPFAYLIDGKKTVTLTNGATIFNEGNYESRPVLIVYGTGSGTITINGKSFSLSNIYGYVTIDSELNQAYKDSTNKGKDMTGEFPVFFNGQNVISWTGGITSVEAKCNWRCY